MVHAARGVNHPRDLLLTRIPVPPCCIRPSVVSEVTVSGSCVLVMVFPAVDFAS